jgi:hypothetical protein
MNFRNWRHDPYVEATFPPEKLERLATELDRLTGFAETGRRSGRYARSLCCRHSAVIRKGRGPTP